MFIVLKNKTVLAAGRGQAPFAAESSPIILSVGTLQQWMQGKHFAQMHTNTAVWL